MVTEAKSMSLRRKKVYLTQVYILPRAEVPRDLDVVPLPPGPFYIKIELFLFVTFSMYIEQNSIVFQFSQRWLSNAGKQNIASLFDVKC